MHRNHDAQSADQLGQLDEPSSPSASSSSASNLAKRGPRTANACEQCKRRKTKCSGRPPPCEACNKAAYACSFDDSAETKSRLKVKVSKHDDQVQCLLNGLLNAIKYNEPHVFEELLQSLRQDASPQIIAAHFQQNLEALKSRGFGNRDDIDEASLLELAAKIAAKPALSHVFEQVAKDASPPQGLAAGFLPSQYMSYEQRAAPARQGPASLSVPPYLQEMQMQPRYNSFSHKSLPNDQSLPLQMESHTAANMHTLPAEDRMSFNVNSDYFQQSGNTGANGDLTPRGHSFHSDPHDQHLDKMRDGTHGTSAAPNLDCLPLIPEHGAPSRISASGHYHASNQDAATYGSAMMEQLRRDPTLTPSPWLQSFAQSGPLQDHYSDNASYDHGRNTQPLQDYRLQSQQMPQPQYHHHHHQKYADTSTSQPNSRNFQSQRSSHDGNTSSTKSKAHGRRAVNFSIPEDESKKS